MLIMFLTQEVELVSVRDGGEYFPFFILFILPMSGFIFILCTCISLQVVS